MSYIGRNPKVRSITCEGFADFTAADASPKREGRLVYVQDEDTLYIDNGSSLSVSGEINTNSNAGAAGATLVKAKVGSDTPIKRLVAGTNITLVENADDITINASGGGGGGLQSFWQKSLSADLTADGVVGDLAISGLTIGNKYKVTLNVSAKRLASGANELQRISFSAVPTFGTFQINADGQVTEHIPYDSVAADVQSALEALSNIGAGEVAVSGDFSTGFEIEFQNGLGATNLPEVIIASSDLATGVSDGTNEIQNLSFSTTPELGSFTITFDGQTTSAIPYNASTTDIENALELLTNINGVTVAGSFGAGFSITFDGTQVEAKDQNQVTTTSSLNFFIVVSPQGASNGANTNWDNFNYAEYINKGASGGYDSANQIVNLQGPSVPNEYIMWAGTAFNTFLFTPGDGYSGGNISLFTNTNGNSLNVISPNFPTGTVVKYEISVPSFSTTGTLAQLWQADSVAGGRVGSGGGLGSLYSASNPSSINIQGTVTVAGTSGNGYFFFQLRDTTTGGFSAVIDYIRFSTASGTVTITPSTSTNGVSPTTGSSVTATPSTLADGAGAISGPSVLFGAEVKHDGSTIGECKYLPSAQNTEDAEVSMSTEGFITATTTTISVESSGLGAAERLEGGDTRIIVEEYDSSLTEN